MMSDQAIRPPDPIDWINYDDGGTGRELPPCPKGANEYSFTPVKVEVDRTKEGYLMAVVDVRVNDPGKSWDGYVARFQRFSTKRWPGKNSSSAGDYLRGHGVRGPLTSDEQYESAFKATLNKPLRGGLDWEIYDSGSGFELKGYDNFPTDASGKKLSVIEHNGRKLFANVKVKYVKSTVPKATATAA